jgi:hypothetical protein
MPSFAASCGNRCLARSLFHGPCADTGGFLTVGRKPVGVASDDDAFGRRIGKGTLAFFCGIGRWGALVLARSLWA